MSELICASSCFDTILILQIFGRGWSYSNVPVIFVMCFSPSYNSLCSPICLSICSFLFPLSTLSDHFIWQQMREIERWRRGGGGRSDSLREKDRPWSFGRGRWADVGRKHEEENRAYCCLQRRCGALTKSVQQLSTALPTFMLFSAGTITSQPCISNGNSRYTGAIKCYVQLYMCGNPLDHLLFCITDR